MQTVNATEAKNSLAQMLTKAQQEPICISQNGQAMAVIMSMDEYQSTQTLRQQILHQHLDKALADVKAGRTRNGPNVHEEMKKKYLNGPR